jgi:hypothetical protein
MIRLAAARRQLAGKRDERSRWRVFAFRGDLILLDIALLTLSARNERQTVSFTRKT